MTHKSFNLKIVFFTIFALFIFSGLLINKTEATVTTNNPTANTGTWTNGANAYTDGTNYANITSGAPSLSQTYSNYGFSLSGNLIDQVRVRADASSIGGATVTTANNYPTSDESNTAAFTTAPLWSKVDDTSDTDFIIGTTNGGGHATFGFTPFSVPTGSTITDVKIYWSQKSTSTAANGAGSLKVGGTYYDGLGSSATTTGFVAKSYTATTNPKTGGSWTAEQVNGTDATNPLQAFGVSGTDFNPDVTFGYVYATVTYTTANNEKLEVEVSYDGGTSWSPSKHQIDLDGTETTYWVDVTGDTAWAPTKLDNTNFRVRVDGLTVGDTGDVRLDWIPVEVTHRTLVAPTVTTPTQASVAQTSVTLGANVTSLGVPSSISERGIVYGTTPNPTGNSTYYTGGGTGAFTIGVTGLTCNTLYYYRGYATNATGTAYSADDSFTTTSCGTFPSVTTNAVTSITTTTATGNGDVTSDGGASITERGIVWNTTTAPTTANFKATSAGTTGVYTASLTSLTPGTLYYVRAYATNAIGTTYGNEVTFNALIAPNLTTPTVTSIGINGATLGANVTSLGIPASISARGTCWGTSPAPTTNCVAASGTTMGVFTHARTGMTAGTFYYYRGYATNTTGTEYSPDGTFTTLANPSLTTPTVTSIGINGATLGANVTSLGIPASISARGTCWGTSPAPTTNCVAASGTTTGVFTHARTGMTAGTFYYYRGYATNTTGTEYSPDGTFTTQTLPTVTSPTKSAILNTTATLGATLTSPSFTVTARGTCWGTTPFPSTNCLSGGTTTGVYTQAITGLSAGILYYYMGYATYTDGAGVSGTVYSTSDFFTTLISPSVTTQAVSSITTTTATGNGNVTSDGGTAITERGIVWNTTTAPTTANFKATSAGTTGVYTASLTSLNPDTLYYVRAYATNAIGTTYGNEVTFTTTKLTVTLGNGTDGVNSTIGPGSSATEIDRFSLVTDVSTDTVTGATVTLAPINAYTNISLVDIQTIGGVSKCSLAPSSNTVLLTGCSISVTTTPTEYKIMITPKAHVNMPSVPGASFDTNATVTSITNTNLKTGTDTGSATITVDNLSPSAVTSSTVSAGDTLANISWTNPGDADFTTNGTVVVLRDTIAVSNVPVEGTTYTVGNTIGTAAVACVLTGTPPGTSCQSTGLINLTSYHYKIFTQDSRGNYNAGTVPSGSPVIPFAPFSISGTTNLSDVSNVVKAGINGTLDGATGSISGGTWNINIFPPTTGQVVTVFVDGQVDASESTAVSKYDGTGTMSGMTLNAGVLSVGSNDNQSLSLTNMSLYDCDNDEDVMHSSNTGTLLVQGCANSYTNETLSVLASNTLTTATTEIITTEKINNMGTITVTGNTVFNLAGTSGTLFTDTGTFNAGTSTTNLIGNGDAVISSGFPSFHNLTINSTGTKSPVETITATNILTITSGTLDTVAGNNYTINAGSVVLNGGILNANASTINLTGTSGTLFTKSSGTFTAGTGTVNLTGNGNAVVASGTPSFYNLTSSGTGTKSLGETLTVTNALTVSGGTLDTGSNYTVNSKAILINGGILNANASTINLTGTSGTLFTKSLGTFTAGTSAVIINSNSNVTVSSGDPTFFNLYLTGGGTISLGENLNVTNVISLNAGTTFNTTTNNYSINASAFDINTGNLVLNNSIFNLSGINTIFNYITGTITPGSSTIKITNSSASNKIFAGGSQAYGNIWFAPGTGTGSLTITGNNTFNNFKDDGTVAHSILFTAGTSQTVSSWNVMGRPGNLITIDSTTTGTHSINMVGGNYADSDYLNIQHSVVTPAGTWYAGENSINNQGIATTGSGWIFTVRLTVKTYDLSGFMFSNNINSTDIYDALSLPNTSAVLNRPGDAFRLRMLVHVDTNDLLLNAQNFKLQYSPKVGMCDDSFIGESYQDITNATSIAYFDNLTPINNTALTSNIIDPTHNGHTISNQSYVESNNFTNSVSTVYVGQDAKWDFSLYDNTSSYGASYCLRPVKSDGNLFDTYSYIPEVRTSAHINHRGGGGHIESVATPDAPVGGGGNNGGGSTVLPQCSDTIDNDGDTLIDALDPGCRVDAILGNPYLPSYNSEVTAPVINTGGGSDGGAGDDIGFLYKIKSIFNLYFFRQLL